ncbi:AraC family transcriptional regulator [Treponema sp. OttesenSCG-928-L16]|nr:AraC family transcriptional regulator [Treponema sp. OttesenSCG-928-L16]
MDYQSLKIPNRMKELDIHFDFHGTKIDVEWYRLKWKSEPYNTFWHAHTHAEVHFLINGALIVETDTRTIHVGEGEALIIPANTPHRLAKPTGQRVLRIVLNCSITSAGGHFESDELVQRIRNALLQVVKLPVYAQQVLLTGFDEMEGANFGYCSIIEANLLIFLFLLGRELGDDPAAKEDGETVKKTFPDLRMESIISYIQDHAYEKISVERLASIMNMSMSQLARTIKQAGHGTPLKIIQSVKIEKARELLKDPNLSISAISEMLGFTNEYHFSRIFKSVEGMPPGKYRQGLCQ